MEAHIYYTNAEAERVARTMDKMGLDWRVVGSAVIGTRGDFKLLMEQTTAPDPVLIAEVA
jgi:hypothetical protein